MFARARDFSLQLPCESVAVHFLFLPLNMPDELCNNNQRQTSGDRGIPSAPVPDLAPGIIPDNPPEAGSHT